jgi:hypothetical protein
MQPYITGSVMVLVAFSSSDKQCQLPRTPNASKLFQKLVCHACSTSGLSLESLTHRQERVA